MYFPGATKLLEGIQVKKILNEGNRVTSIETDAGTVKCDYFINAAGLVSVIFVLVPTTELSNFCETLRLIYIPSN